MSNGQRVEWTPHDLTRWLVSKVKARSTTSKSLRMTPNWGTLMTSGWEMGSAWGVGSAAERERIIGFAAELKARPAA
jgi:hypothetical protein